MSPLVIDEQGTQSTTAGGSMRPSPASMRIFDLGDLTSFGTAAHSLSSKDLASWVAESPSTSSYEGTIGIRAQERLDTCAAISELRRLAGLTWERLAEVFGVARRSLHFWASGRPINAPNEEHLRRLLTVIKQVDRGTAQQNRELLLHEYDGVIPIDVLTERNYNEFLQLVGEGPGRRHIELRPLSKEAQEARRPLPPEQLVDALQDRVHRDVGRGRAARTARKTQRRRDG